MEQGLYLMAVGMGTVFAFLTLLVVVMNVSGRLFERFGGPVQVEGPTTGTADDTEAQHREIAVVLAAVEAWRRQQSSGGS